MNDNTAELMVLQLVDLLFPIIAHADLNLPNATSPPTYTGHHHEKGDVLTLDYQIVSFAVQMT